MARSWRAGQLLLVFVVAYSSVLAVESLHPLSDIDKSFAKKLFVAQEDGSYGSSVEETYQAIRSLQALGSEDYDAAKISGWISESLTSSNPNIKDVFYGLRAIELLHGGKEGAAVGSAVAPRVLAAVKESQSLVDLYYSVGALATIKKHHWSEDSHHIFAPAVKDVLGLVKSLSGGHGTWRYSEDETESTAKAAGFAFDVTAGVIEIAGLEGVKSEVRSIKAAVAKLFENTELYDDGQYFDESSADRVSGSGGALSASAMVLRGVCALAAVLPDGLRVKEEKMFGLASFFLSFGTSGTPTDVFYQLDALSILEDNRVLVPLAVYLPTSVLSLSSLNPLEVAVTTVLGSPAPEVVVSLLSVTKTGKGNSPVLTDEELKSNEAGHIYALDILSKVTELGRYDLKLEVKPASAELSYKYSAGGLTVAHIVLTGLISVSNIELAVLDSDTGSPEAVRSLSFEHKDTAQLSANHLQNLRVSFELTSPSGRVYRPQQVFFKLKHERGVEHLFLVRNSGGRVFQLNLDFLGLVEKLYYLSGTYTLELTVGDTTMENSFLWTLGSLDLDLPDAPEGAAKPPPQAVDLSTKFGPKPEISHVFRVPEKRPGAELSLTFLVLTLLPLVGFFVALYLVGANVKVFPTSGVNLLAALGFHGGILAILTLYLLFWLKFNLFTTLKALAFLGLFTSVAGHFILSHLADLSSKMKTA